MFVGGESGWMDSSWTRRGEIEARAGMCVYVISGC